MGDTRTVHIGFRSSLTLAALALLAGCGGTTVHGATPTPPPVTAAPHKPVITATPTPTPVEEERVFVDGPPPIAYRTQAGAATLHIRRYSWQHTAYGKQSAPPAHQYVVMDVRITATEGRVPVNPLYFVARTTNQTFAPTLGADGNEPVLASTDLNVGDSVDGLVTFDAPPTRLIVQINDELGRNVGEVVLPAPPPPPEGTGDAAAGPSAAEPEPGAAQPEPEPTTEPEPPAEPTTEEPTTEEPAANPEAEAPDADAPDADAPEAEAPDAAPPGD